MIGYKSNYIFLFLIRYSLNLSFLVDTISTTEFAEMSDVLNGNRKNSSLAMPTDDFVFVCANYVLAFRWCVEGDVAGKCRNKRAEWC